ncbi:hypothetical protein NQZ68_013064 [Dissostichus eleginoides]|nr:hypothetical protein NQZ68_013064 [Dissostichus eleginoides]
MSDGSPYLYVIGGDSLNPVCRVPKAPQHGNCILIQATPLCAPFEQSMECTLEIQQQLLSYRNCVVCMQCQAE